MRYKLHMPFGSRPDLAVEAANSLADIGHIHMWANGIECPRVDSSIVTYHEIGLCSIPSLMNVCLKESWDDDVAFFAHNDMVAKPGVAKQFLEYVTATVESKRKFGVVFSHYDVLCAFNMQAVHDVGYWDVAYFQYVADVDYYCTLNKAGWPIIDFPDGHIFRDGITHYGSTSRKADHIHNLRVQFFDRLRAGHEYYKVKWGGLPGNEKFSRPFEHATLPPVFRPHQAPPPIRRGVRA